MVKRSFQLQSFDKAARGGLGTRLGYGHGSRSLAACSISAGIERDSIELYIMSVHDRQCSETLRKQFLGS